MKKLGLVLLFSIFLAGYYNAKKTDQSSSSKSSDTLDNDSPNENVQYTCSMKSSENNVERSMDVEFNGTEDKVEVMIATTVVDASALNNDYVQAAYKDLSDLFDKFKNTSGISISRALANKIFYIDAVVYIDKIEYDPVLSSFVPNIPKNTSMKDAIKILEDSYGLTCK